MKSTTAVLLALGWLWTAQCQLIALYPCQINHEHYIELDTEQTDMVLAHHLRLDAFSDRLLGKNDGFFETFLAQIAHDGENFVGRGIESAMIVDVESASSGFLPDELQTNVVELMIPEGEEETFSFAPTISVYLHKASSVYRSISSSRLPPTEMLDINIFSASTSESVHQFLSDLTTLVNFVDRESRTASEFGGFVVHGLSGIMREFGSQSEQYLTAVAVLKATLQKAMTEKIRMAVLLSPPVTSSVLGKRQIQPPQAPLPPNQNSSLPPQEPYFSTSTCYTTLDDCTRGTSSCSGHGACTNATRTTKGEQKTCFVCACQATTSDKGSKTVWVGAACEKEDISGPFILLAGTTIGVLALIFGAIAILTVMGDEKLPGVLTAGATGGVAHLKRS